MSDIIKTWPAHVDLRSVQQMFRPRWNDAQFLTYYFTLGRGKPKVTPENIWYTWRGRILGSFRITDLARNDGSFPQLSRADGEEGTWHIAPDAWVAICDGDIVPLRERVYMSGFRGWRYFNLDEYRTRPEATVRL